ncbi:MAG TPA: hypothetical protein VGS07_31515 [Thermoanaerobaculia bacterium]|jgi:hypothetical protein|nr:hypothetical protein [Thermoanaerobaculia bacterium]
MKKDVLKKGPKLQLSRETLHILEEPQLLKAANGGFLTKPYVQCTGTGTLLC